MVLNGEELEKLVFHAKEVNDLLLQRKITQEEFDRLVGYYNRSLYSRNAFELVQKELIKFQSRITRPYVV